MIGRTESINGIQLYYEIHGQGEPLVLLHGFTGNGATWGKIGQELSKKFQVIIPDLRGHGHSTNDQSHYTFRQVALDIYALLDKLNITNFKAMGASAGGNTLLHMATQQPDRIEAMVIISATSHYPDQARKIMSETSVDGITEEQWQWFRTLHFHGDAQIRKLYEGMKGFASDYEDMKFTSKDLGTIATRTMIVQGDRDPIYPIDLSIEMYRAIPKSSLWIIPQAGHVPITAENTDYFIELAAKFLEN